jgi:hypothetical protein
VRINASHRSFRLTYNAFHSGNSQRGQHIYPGATLIFTLELIKVKGPSQGANTDL